tara:strand:- start:266 stop:763 length:498 start_codon:yes stop_codon:yes gene_type:complete
MILTNLFNKENKDKKIANNIYNNILKLSNSFIKENDFFISKDYNSSFEIVSIYLIFFIKFNIIKKKENYKKVNEHLIAIFISDLDESLRAKGIGDMSIGKYVKSYVKKFYFRLSKFPLEINENNTKVFNEYLKLFDLIIKNHEEIASKKFIKDYLIIENSYINYK